MSDRSEQEHRYTSTGIKFWQHPEQMRSYLYGEGRSVVSTHIAPEGACNLSCPYCSVTHRDTHNRIALDVILDYVDKLQRRGLKAVIITGGGEPTVYKHINELIESLLNRRLKFAMITNGTLTHRVDPDLWKYFSWVRVSVNLFKNWDSTIGFPHWLVDTDLTTIGCSMVFTKDHEQVPDDWLSIFEKVSRVADRCGAKYIRVLPNCLLPEPELAAQHRALDHLIQRVGDPRFFRQDKHHRTPKASVCHQSYFRPYLSEECFGDTDVPGAVYPCDSVVLNDGRAKFTTNYQICAPWDILDYLDRKTPPAPFDPRHDCSGCVFTDTVDMLDDWKSGAMVPPGAMSKDEIHDPEFV